MEDSFNGGSAEWEITRYAGVNHGFTVLGGGAYDITADARSWDSMLKFFTENFIVPNLSDAPTMAPSAMVPFATMAPGADADAASGVLGTLTALIACVSALFFF